MVLVSNAIPDVNGTALALEPFAFLFLTSNFSTRIKVTNVTFSSPWPEWPPGGDLHVWFSCLCILVWFCCGISHFKKQGMLNNKHIFYIILTPSELFKCKYLNANALQDWMDQSKISLILNPLLLKFELDAKSTKLFAHCPYTLF